MEQMTDPEEILKRIGRVDPPPFLFTRIEARIAATVAGSMPIGRAVTLLCGLAVVLMLNALMLLPSERNAPREGRVDAAPTMEFRFSNQIYHE